ncbi:uncharacterized protein K02A2.6-like [Musca vetustissima]|uniref:uncharacterized protein K02A2.6-like n=1 Tax=Musca vetustissima TaxID=27455 RepID=UPI002AB746F3|nr:uncharacterized protein K02A2.6-like [Musca vetustissima]
MKGVAKSVVYWPGLDKDIEEVAKACDECGQLANEPTKFAGHHWQYPRGPWERIHIDYAGPFVGRMLLVVTDAYSKWIEVKITSSTSSAATIDALVELFSHSTAQGSIDNSDDENIVTSDHSLGEIEPEEATLEDGFINPQSDFHGFTSGNIERTSNTPQQEPCTKDDNNGQMYLSEWLQLAAVHP